MRDKILTTINMLKNQETTYDTWQIIEFIEFDLKINIIRDGEIHPHMLEMSIIDKDGYDMDVFITNIDNQLQINDDISYILRCYYNEYSR